MSTSSKQPPFDSAAGHRYFSADYFNRVWDYLGKENRDPADDQRMLSMCHASLAHWLDREDCGAQELSIGYWQLSRVYSVLGKGDAARDCAASCLDASVDLSAFYLGFAHEAMSRAEKVRGDAEAAMAQLTKARDLLEKIESDEERTMLATDLDELSA